MCLGWELVALIKCPLGRCGINTPTSVTTSQVSQMMSVGRGNISERRQIVSHYTSRNFSIRLHALVESSKHTADGVREPSETALVAVHDCTLG